jgi:hypothetical protein
VSHPVRAPSQPQEHLDGQLTFRPPLQVLLNQLETGPTEAEMTVILEPFMGLLIGFSWGFSFS